MSVILITGASSGIGYAAAEMLAKQGNRVYGAARRVERIGVLQSVGVYPLQMDLTDDNSIQAGVKAVLDAEGRIDILINNAGYGYFGAIETTPPEEARRQLEVNVFGLSRLCSLVLPGMRERRSGRIINIASIAGRACMYFGGWYNVSKYAVEAFSDCLRMEMKPFGIDVVLIEPGGIHTNWGIIAADHLKESSAGSAYEKEASIEADMLHYAYSSNILADPSVVSKAICKAVNSRRPRVRYIIGSGARIMLFLHAVLPSRLWDSMVRQAGKFRIRK